MERKKWEKEQKRRICFFDLDGVLNYYPKTWLDFVNEKTGHSFKSLFTMKAKLAYDAYTSLKKEYRTCGIKEHFPPRLEAKTTLERVHKLGYYIVIISSRPIQEYPSLISQTVHWLDKHFVYDELLFEEQKHIPVITKYPFLHFGVEDNHYYANLVAKWGYKIFLVSNRYNKGEWLHENVIRIKKLSEVLNEV